MTLSTGDGCDERRRVGLALKNGADVIVRRALRATDVFLGHDSSSSLCRLLHRTDLAVCFVDPLLIQECLVTDALVGAIRECRWNCIVYSGVSAAAFRALHQMPFLSGCPLVVQGVDDAPAHLLALSEGVAEHTDAMRLLESVSASLDRCSLPLRRVLENIVRHPEEYFDATDVSRSVGLPRRSLDRAFVNAELGTAKRFVVVARVWRAVTLKCHTGCGAAAIARRLGYSSADALSRHVRLILGVTASDLRPCNLDVYLGRIVTYARSGRTQFVLGHGSVANHGGTSISVGDARESDRTISM